MPERPAQDPFHDEALDQAFRDAETLSPEQWLARAAIRKEAEPGYIKPEVLVRQIRKWNSQGDHRAGSLLTSLLARTRGTALCMARQFLPAHLHDDFVDDCESELAMAIIQVRTESSAFLERRFNLAARRRRLEVLKRYRRSEPPQGSVSLDDAPDCDMPTFDVDYTDAVAARAWVQTLSERERELVAMLVMSASQDDIAEHFKVVDRTVRNWITALKRSYSDYCGGQR